MCSARVAAEMEALASESATRTNSVWEAGRRLGLLPSSIHNILHGVQYPYKLQSCHELLQPDTVEKEKHLRVKGWKMVTVNAQPYLTLLCGKVVPCLYEKDALSAVTFMQDGATSHTSNPVKESLIRTFEVERIISKRCKFP
ncbi:hypothetical protein NPIL_688821 [Nephila pilipes]|uniref:Uncharacterized protein n=1 Tax=Nephila pilipes TaxID=299642 RepID=A0A8X6QYW8_NEPPI|nr:hypothetical protein NPIL_688821 [Nephila pilipes]